MTSTMLFPNAPDISAEDYCAFGLATCFIRNDGEIEEVRVIEPVPSSALEALLKGIPTSYQFVCGKSLSEFFAAETLQKPTEFPEDAQFCESFVERTLAAARTYKSHPKAKEHIPLGNKKEDFNYSTERKRVLNIENTVSTEDNVKQHSHTHKVL
ncbi:hypothetical protein [Spirulina sp. 06S082]|uniref:hypothetical protein n=1 Tax=Spirulina sp. 06S082 TaxID=3110248 RepID=UPI002B203A5C|nr:hypothetical protein [Spirulina sp. 06S082]MEA5467744.1 hypothetical protein [Spirulina sp. 06S082]